MHTGILNHTLIKISHTKCDGFNEMHTSLRHLNMWHTRCGLVEGSMSQVSGLVHSLCFLFVVLDVSPSSQLPAATSAAWCPAVPVWTPNHLEAQSTLFCKLPYFYHSN